MTPEKAKEILAREQSRPRLVSLISEARTEATKPQLVRPAAVLSERYGLRWVLKPHELAKSELTGKIIAELAKLHNTRRFGSGTAPGKVLTKHALLYKVNTGRLPNNLVELYSFEDTFFKKPLFSAKQMNAGWKDFETLLLGVKVRQHNK
ncbi:hypothetical protein HY546_00800 [archaeon]|nr:hypothetical protein [archaeon]